MSGSLVRSKSGVAAARLAPWTITAAAAALVAGNGIACGAPPPERLTLVDMAGRADLVFQGVVEDIQFILSEPTGAEQRRVPFTFVTYRVDTTMRGQGVNDGDLVTLRFLGGYHAENGTVMAPSNAPRIDLGDKDILFVQGNTVRHCPLVGDSLGRLRIIGDQVYSEMGRAVQLVGRDDFAFGAQYRIDDVAITSYVNQELVLTFDGKAKDLPSDAVRLEAFLDQMGRALVRTPAPAQAFVSADPEAPLPGPDMTPAAPPEVKPEERDAAPAESPAETSPPRKG